MSVAGKAVTTATVAGLILGAGWYFQPHSPAEVEQHQREEQVGQLADSRAKDLEKLQEDGKAVSEADRRQRLRPVESRPTPRVRVRVRW